MEKISEIVSKKEVVRPRGGLLLGKGLGCKWTEAGDVAFPRWALGEGSPGICQGTMMNALHRGEDCMTSGSHRVYVNAQWTHFTGGEDCVTISITLPHGQPYSVFWGRVSMIQGLAPATEANVSNTPAFFFLKPHKTDDPLLPHWQCQQLPVDFLQLETPGRMWTKNWCLSNQLK